MTSHTFNQEIHKHSASGWLLGLVGFLLIFMIAVVGIYVNSVRPKILTLQYITKLHPPVATLHADISGINDAIDTLYQLTVLDQRLVSSDQPDISFSQDAQYMDQSRAYEKTKDDELSELERSVTASIHDMYSHTNRLGQNRNSDVAGMQSISENISIREAVKLKTLAESLDSNITNARTRIGQIKSLLASRPLQNPKFYHSIHESIRQTERYITEAEKTAQYFILLSEVIIAIHTQSYEYTSAIDAAIDSIDSSIETMELNQDIDRNIYITRTKSSLQKAKKSVNNIAYPIKRLNDYPTEKLPQGATLYHRSTSDILNNFLIHVNTYTQTIEDVLLVYETTSLGNQNEFQSVNDTIQSEIQKTLVHTDIIDPESYIVDGQNLSSTITFWQDSPLFSLGNSIEKQITEIEQILDQIQEDNTPQFMQ